MTHIRKLALALFLAFLSTSYSNSQDLTNVVTGIVVPELAPGQVYNTGNLTNFTNQSTDVTSTWQNAGTIGSPLTCWGPGGQGYCGPQPMVAAWGTGSNIINFSYGLTDLHQYVNIGKALANSGSGLQINGFNFSFMAKNGNGWDNGQQDYLSAYVKFYDNTNSKVVENYNYDLNYKFGWTQFNYDETFTTPYALNKLGNARYGFVGGDSNFWAGPYGPEVSNTNFSLKYSVDPCASNPLYSPTCPGYLDAIAKLAPPATVAEAPPPPPPPPSDGAPAPPLPPPGSPQPGPPQPGPPPPPGSPALAGSTTAVASSPPPPPSSQPARAGEPAAGSKPTVSLSTIMNILSTESARVGAVEKAVVTTATAGAESAAAQATQQAEAVASTLTSQSVAASTAQSSASGSVSGVTSAVRLETGSGVSLQNSTVPGLGLQLFNQTSSGVDTYTAGVTQSTVQNAGIISERNLYSLETEVIQPEGIKFGVRSTLSDYLNEQPWNMMQGTAPNPDSAIKQNVQSNEAAGAVDLASMATQPRGYEAYSQMTLSDAAFYKPEPIYQNQRTVDNARAFRGLASDARHQEMVNSQYKLGE